jgi:hypothetical protein
VARLDFAPSAIADTLEILLALVEKAGRPVAVAYFERFRRRSIESPPFPIHCLDENEYPKAIKVSDAEMAAIKISRDDFHGEWNHTIAPVLTGPDDANRPVAGFEVEG